MNEKLEKQLREKYPKILNNLFEGRWAQGISCDDGWYNILDVLCQTIQSRVKNCGIEQVVAEQIKEKFGGLRFYCRGGDEITDAYVWLAEEMSYRTCEECGNVGEIREGGWIKTLCDKHAEK